MSLRTNLSNKFGKHLLNTATITGKKCFKNCDQKGRNKSAKTSKIAKKTVKPKPALDKNFKNVEERNYSTRPKRRNIKRIKTIIIKMGHYEISNLLNDSAISKFLAKIALK